MIKETLKKIAEVTDNYTTIETKFSINAKKKWDDPEEAKKIPQVKWQLYIADITTKTGNAFPEFDTLEQLDAFVNILCLELKRVKLNAIEDAVEIATELFKKEFKKEV